MSWQVYFIVGFLLSVYVFYVFLGKMRTLFEHDAIEHAEAAAEAAAQAASAAAADRESQP